MTQNPFTNSANDTTPLQHIGILHKNPSRIQEKTEFSTIHSQTQTRIPEKNGSPPLLFPFIPYDSRFCPYCFPVCLDTIYCPDRNSWSARIGWESVCPDIFFCPDARIDLPGYCPDTIHQSVYRGYNEVVVIARLSRASGYKGLHE